MNNLSDHIDEPIKKCVMGMKLLGIEPWMSCCGFSYEGEKVKKKHLGKAYMYIKVPEATEKAALLLELSYKSRWILSPEPDAEISFFDFYWDTWSKKHPWADKDCPHHHENFVIGIHMLEKTLENKLGSLDMDKGYVVELRDGNEWYDKNLKHWQYKPANPWVFTYGDFLNQ